MLRHIFKTVARRGLQNTRNLHVSPMAFAAKIYGMPAMSPTMESGAIVDWKVKEGEHYNSGDSLLDIETDKATISVDAIDDGILAKILLPNGTKDVKVGTPIAYLAEDGDDIKTLEYPALPDESATAPAPTAEVPKETAKPAAPAPTPGKAAPSPTPAPATSSSSSASHTANPGQRFFPSVERLLDENHISREDAIAKIPATGPHGRILIGDVLAYLGQISASQNDAIAAYIEKSSHLDLSNIHILKPEPKAVAEDKPKAKKVKEPVVIQESYPIDLEISYPELSKFKSVIANAISVSEQKAYAYNINAESDLDDPLFDDIIAPSRNADRFKVDYALNAEGDEISSLDLKLTLNDSCFDAKDRATVFVTSFKASLANDLKVYQ